MKKLLCTLALLAASATQAAPVYVINATTDALPPTSDFSNLGFALIYEDLDLDMRFDLGELLVFGGYNDPVAGFYDQLLAIPDLPSVEGSGNGLSWRFGNGFGELEFSAATFTPFTEAVGVIPAPGAAALALLGLALMPRRRQA